MLFQEVQINNNEPVPLAAWSLVYGCAIVLELSVAKALVTRLGTDRSWRAMSPSVLRLRQIILLVGCDVRWVQFWKNFHGQK
jgi:hypothetical protein